MRHEGILSFFLLRLCRNDFHLLYCFPYGVYIGDAFLVLRRSYRPAYGQLANRDAVVEPVHRDFLCIQYLRSLEPLDTKTVAPSVHLWIPSELGDQSDHV